MKTSCSIVLGAALLPACFPIFANESAENPHEFFVTATRTNQALSDVIGSISSISREEIDASGALDLHDLLRTQPGIDIVRSGPSGAQTSVFMRGTESDHVLVLVNGVRVNAPTSGGAIWGEIPLDQVERIEVVRGPRSAQFGSDAIGGVIQIFTRQAGAVSIALTAGSYATREATVSAGYHSDLLAASVTASQGQTDGFSATNEGAGAFSFNADDDGREYKNASVNLEATLSDNASIGSSWLYNQQDTEIDQTGEQLGRSRQLGLWAEFSNNRNADIRLQTSRLQQEIADIVASRSQAGIQTNLNLGQAILFSLGYEFSQDAGVDPGDYEEQSDLRSLYLQQQFTGDFLDVVLAARRDTHSRFGSNNTASLSLGGWVGDHRVFASYGTGFRAPNLTDLFHPGFNCGAPCFGGNPNLKPEKSRSAEVGLDALLSSEISLQFALFTTEIENLIVGAFSGAQNVDESDIQGAELSFRSAYQAWTFNASATWQQARKANGDQLLRRPDRKASVRLQRTWSKVNAALEVIAASQHRDFVGSAEGDVAGYALVNLRANYQASKQLALNLSGENLGDVFYQTAFGFNNPGRSGYLTIKWTAL
ncbi:MAG: vitamin B12 transporter [Pseudoalteromonas tetraodonis]|jgi:vitamin B12 transporter